MRASYINNEFTLYIIDVLIVLRLFLQIIKGIENITKYLKLNLRNIVHAMRTILNIKLMS